MEYLISLEQLQLVSAFRITHQIRTQDKSLCSYQLIIRTVFHFRTKTGMNMVEIDANVAFLVLALDGEIFLKQKSLTNLIKHRGNQRS